MIEGDGYKKAFCNGANNMCASVTLAETYANSLEQNVDSGLLLLKIERQLVLMQEMLFTKLMHLLHLSI